MLNVRRVASLAVVAGLAVVFACSSRPSRPVTKPTIIPHGAWQATPPVGHAADAMRRYTHPGDSLTFKTLTVAVRATRVDSSGSAPVDEVQLTLAAGTVREERMVREGGAFNWRGYHLAVVAVYGPGELRARLVALEVATVSSLPRAVALSDSAGGAELRLRIPHRITHVTLHHTGDARILSPADDRRSAFATCRRGVSRNGIGGTRRTIPAWARGFRLRGARLAVHG